MCLIVVVKEGMNHLDRHEWGMLYLDHSCELICEHETSSWSKAIGQVLLHHFGILLVRVRWSLFVSTWGTRDNTLLTEGYLLVCCAFMWGPWGWVLWWQDVFTSAKKTMTSSSGFWLNKSHDSQALFLRDRSHLKGKSIFLSTRFLILILQWGLWRHNLEKLLLRLMSVSFVVESGLSKLGHG